MLNSELVQELPNMMPRSTEGAKLDLYAAANRCVQNRAQSIAHLGRPQGCQKLAICDRGLHTSGNHLSFKSSMMDMTNVNCEASFGSAHALLIPCKVRAPFVGRHKQKQRLADIILCRSNRGDGDLDEARSTTRDAGKRTLDALTSLLGTGGDKAEEKLKSEQHRLHLGC